jgi:predicted NAD-dependent protein-ADP-ribosyltransferase YbiA (DUF1768 family)
MKQRELFTPRADGIDHLNVYSRARTAEGKLLSNFTRTPFVLDGVRFESVEGFYHTLLFEDDELRARLAGLWGAPAKSWGKVSRKQPGDPVRTWDGRVIAFDGPAFDDEVRRAITAKVEQHPAVQEALLSTERLPLTHYYVIMGRPVLPRGERNLLASQFTALRKQLWTRPAIRQLLGPLAEAGCEDLLTALNNHREEVRLEAARALAFQDDLDPEAVAHAVAHGLTDGSAAYYQRALRTLVQLNLKAEVAVPIFRQALAHDSLVVRVVAARKLGQFGPQAGEAIPELRRAARQDTDPIVRRFAEQALEQIEAGRSTRKTRPQINTDEHGSRKPPSLICVDPC